MSLKLKDAPKANSVNAPAGNHAARCYAVIDLGTHTETGQYGTKTNRKLRFSWELPDEMHTFDDKKGPEPFAVHKTYNFTMGEKSTLRKDLESWRGKPFTDEEMDAFELKALLGAACMLNVVHAAKGDKTYANIENITPLPKALKNAMPKAILPTIYYEITDGQNAVYGKLPEFLRKMIDQAEDDLSKSDAADGGAWPDDPEPADQDGNDGPEEPGF